MPVGRLRKNARKAVSGKKLPTKAIKDKETKNVAVKENIVANMNALASVAARLSHLTPMKPMSHQQRCFVQLHHVFMLRNLEKVRKHFVLKYY